MVAQAECCPRLEAQDWDRKEHQWQGKPFYRVKYRSLFHIPLNIGRVVTRAMAEIESRGLNEEPTLMLSREESLFSSTLLISVKEEGDGLATERLSGTYLSRLFEGSYRDTGKWVKEAKAYCQEQGKPVAELLFWYVTCPKCTKKYGSAQTVILAKVA